jgi:hypothetical protein
MLKGVWVHIEIFDSLEIQCSRAEVISGSEGLQNRCNDLSKYIGGERSESTTRLRLRIGEDWNAGGKRRA